MHSLFRAFHHRNFALFFFGQTVSMIGTWSQMLAISWLVWRMTHSAIWLGIIGFATQAPMLVLGLPGGAVADRFDRLKSLNLMQVLCMLQAFLLGALTLTGEIKLWQVLCLAVFLGMVYSFEFPIRQSFVMDMVGKHDLLNAVSLNSAMFHATRILGPVAAGGIVAWAGEGICFIFNGATFIVLIIALFLVNRDALLHTHHVSSSLKDSILEGLRHMWGHRESKLALIIVAIISGIGMQFTTLMPIFADEIYKGGAVYLGYLMGAGGTGALTGALWLAKRGSSEKLLHLALKASVIFSLALIAFSFTTHLWLALPSISIVGFFLTIILSGINTLLQHATPDHLRGRMMSLFTITFVGLSPFGGLVAGFTAQEIGSPLTLAICGAVCLISSFLIWIRSRR